MTEFDDGIEKNIGKCPYGFESHLKTEQAHIMLMAKAEETQVPISIEGGQSIGLHNFNLSQWMDMPTLLGKQTSPQGVTTLSTNTSKEGTQHGTSFECHIIDAS